MRFFRVVYNHHQGWFVASPGHLLLLIGVPSRLEAWSTYGAKMGHSTIDSVEPGDWIRHRILVLLVMQRGLHLPTRVGLLLVLHVLILVLLSLIRLRVVRVVV